MLNKKLNEIEFIIFDLETTGLDPFSGDRIIEIAAKKFKNLQKIDSFYSLINPKRPISEGAYLVNQIPDALLKDAPKSEEVMRNFSDFLKGSCLMGYNVNFDLGFLNNEFSFIKKSIPQDLPIVDVLKIARGLLPELGRYSLLNVSQFLNINNQQKHRAQEDVELTFNVFIMFLEILAEKGIFDFSNFLQLFGVNTKLHSFLSNIRLAQVQEAIDSGLKLKIKYFSTSSAKVTEREITPKEVLSENNKYFLECFCHLRNEKRSLRIDRILELQMLQPKAK
ncbi:MAG: exonuclease domain-containing protein [Candidatus Omnitrophota bacterium]|nr:exonuclease domain-containing protein [Candidatus Omnitrophota bacterium]